MFALFTVRVVVALVAFFVAGLGTFAYFVIHGRPAPPAPAVVEVSKPVGPEHRVIGISVERRTIDEYSFGSGAKHIVFVGGIHGGYEWNSVVLAYTLMEYLGAHQDAVPASETITVIPDANPDAVYKAIGKAGRFAALDVPGGDLSAERFNAHAVDLNRNFDCKWRSTGTWRSKTVSAGTAPFSEPEAAALRDYFIKEKPDAVIFWHSQANAVYASQCGKGILPQTLDIMSAYAQAAGYPMVKEFTAYATTGASEDWLASIGIPAITVELSTHESVEWDKNLKGIIALLDYFK